MDDSQENYTVQHIDTGNIHEVQNLLDHSLSQAPTDTPTNLPIPHIPWIKHNCKVTLYLKSIMEKLQQGYLSVHDNSWQFLPGQKKNKTPIDLVEGWKSQVVELNARIAQITSNLIAKNMFNQKVNASNLHLMEAPVLLKHEHLHPEGKYIQIEIIINELTVSFIFCPTLKDLAGMQRGRINKRDFVVIKIK